MGSLDKTARASGAPSTPISLSINILRVSNNECVTRQSVVIEGRSSMPGSLPDGNWPEDILFEHQRSASVSTPRDEAADEVLPLAGDILEEGSSPVFESVQYFDPSPGTTGPASLPAADVVAPAPLDGDTEHVAVPMHVPAAQTTPARLGPNDFELLRVVGQGAFGKVFQVRKCDTGDIYAMKVMRKERILERDHGEYVRAERDVLTAVFHPYIVTLRYSFQTSTKLYLVLDFINGGHLFFQLYRQGIFSEELTRLYTAEMVLAIAHLHSLGFVHRDLKPENVLLDSEGHIKVTDFGLAKGNMGDEDSRTNSFIGTMEYMAPEIVTGRGHGKAVDWWSVGILTYEMLCGVPPFRAKSRAALQKQITSGKLKLPPYLSSSAQSLLKALLTREASKRLGHGAQGSADIKAHPFFKAINWTALEQRRVPSPFKPTLKCIDSVENFDKIWTDITPVDSPCASPARAGGGDDHFQGFTYVAPSCIADLMASFRVGDA